MDATTGLTVLGARWYDPTLGRFTTVDPVLAPDNPVQDNGYAYAGNNPVTFTDPSGACFLGPDYQMACTRPAAASTPDSTRDSTPGPVASAPHFRWPLPFVGQAPAAPGVSTYQAMPAVYHHATTPDRATRHTNGGGWNWGLTALVAVAVVAVAAAVTCIVITVGVCAGVGAALGVTAEAGADVGGAAAADVAAEGAAETGGAASVRLGQAGESAVRSVYDIGPKATRVIGGRTRIFDGLSDSAVAEVKNVRYQAYTQQLKDSLAYAQENGLRFDLYVRGGANPTTLSGPLQDAISNTPGFDLEFIP